MSKAGQQMIEGMTEAITMKNLMDENDALRAENEKLRNEVMSDYHEGWKKE